MKKTLLFPLFAILLLAANFSHADLTDHVDPDSIVGGVLVGFEGYSVILGSNHPRSEERSE